MPFILYPLSFILYPLLAWNIPCYSLAPFLPPENLLRGFYFLFRSVKKKHMQNISASKLAHCWFYTSRLSRGVLPRIAKLVLRLKFPLDRHSAVLYFERSHPAVPLARQLVNQGFTILGPLVQKNDSLSFLAVIDHHRQRPKKIGSVLFLNALNPTHVPLSSANSRTLGIFFNSRM